MSRIDRILARFTFRHQSPDYHRVLRPLTYRELVRSRDNPTYVRERRADERQYHDLLGTAPADRDTSFLYATVAGCHKMAAADDYPGYTFYFTMTRPQVERAIFFVVNDDRPYTEPAVGLSALVESLAVWAADSAGFRSRWDDLLDGYIDPRIEVIIPQPVRWSAYVPQVEDRS